MSFKVEIEIKGYGGDDCLDCPFLLWCGNEEPAECRAFNAQLEFAERHYPYGEREWYPQRLPECLEAEKQYKEKENA